MEIAEKYEVIGEFELDAEGNIAKLERRWFRQGYTYKNPNAYFNDKSAVCYIPELSDSTYTADDFQSLCGGEKELADELFEGVDWQHPETLIEDWVVNGEWLRCRECQKLFSYYNENGNTRKKCPHCGTRCEED